jgi:hypothetical protein
MAKAEKEESHFRKLLELFEIPIGVWDIGKAIYEAVGDSVSTCRMIHSFDFSGDVPRVNATDTTGFDTDLFGKLLLVAGVVAVIAFVVCLLLQGFNQLVRPTKTKTAWYEKLLAFAWTVVMGAIVSVIAEAIKESATGGCFGQ